MGAIDPAGNIRVLGPSDQLKDDEYGLSEKQYNILKPLSKSQRAATYKELRNKGIAPHSVLPKSLRQ